MRVNVSDGMRCKVLCNLQNAAQNTVMVTASANIGTELMSEISSLVP